MSKQSSLPGSSPSPQFPKPPTQRQLDYIANLGGDPAQVQSRKHALEMIHSLEESSESLATNRQLARLIFIGVKSDPRNFSMEYASELLGKYINDYNSQLWHDYKVWRQLNGKRDVPSVRLDYEGARAEIEQWRNENVEDLGLMEGCLIPLFELVDTVMSMIIVVIIAVVLVVILFWLVVLG